ncbi:glycosyltransferase family 87 protein [Stackebrandtia soli]|uniref:glycosyltransferase family 87 protein n=1 Tax=Stackebrandtia soli TaxID=1892856 RepID=UPI0039ED78EB
MRRQSLFVDLVLYGVSALFAGYTMWWSTLPSHQHWAAIAIGGYLPAAIVTVMLLGRYAVPATTRLWVAIGTGVAVSIVPLLAQAWQRVDGLAGRAQEEVVVVEDSAARLLDTGSPYLDLSAIAALDDPLTGYNPYQPGMAVFGLPRALFGDHWFTDARVWFAIATFGVLAVALRLLKDAGAPTGAIVRAIQAVAVLPITALTLATGGDDLPVLALALLALTAAFVRRPVLAGVAIGLAAALKLFAWPVLVVLAFLAWRRGELRRYLPAALPIPVVTITPVLITNADALIANVIDFPSGNGLVTSPAASPLPGYLLTQHVPGGRFIALGLLVAVACAMAVYLLRRPPADAALVAAICAVGILAAILLMPATRFGYLLYPGVYAIWWWVLTDTADPNRRLTPATATGGATA